ncbi:hypothetical protein EII20_07645 [Comamonadaceae bacterium OH2545_COT-014]|nr:hypothetical protein EII20_07645 [Comamonadaceae bacterium OH2545_COT-014]
MNRSMRIGVLLACLLLLAAVTWWARAGAKAWPGVAWQPPSAQPLQLESVLAATLAPHSGMHGGGPALLQRPLFHASRRPPPPAQPAAQAAQPAQTSLEKMRLLGVLDSAALTGVMALVDDETRFLKRGDEVGGWTLAEIRGRQVVFVSRGERRTLELPHAHMAPPADQAAASQDTPPTPAAAGRAVTRTRRP